MPQLVKKRRSGWALLAVSALVASLFAVGASPAHGDVIGADDSEAEASNKATATACLGEARDDYGFTDLGSLEAAAVNINCLAYYGITVGKTADTFAPNDDVKRSEMALFLYRAAGLMGVDLMGGDMMADFGDVSELGEDRQNAIKALARNGILEGRGDMGHFYPNADITRAEMAVALVALLDHTPGAPVHKDKDTGLYKLGADAGGAMLPDDSFADARATQPRHIDNAISAAYELGITTGTGDGKNFSPSWSVPRRDMATFIIRALAHSNVRPAGLTAQNVKGTITVSVRDADFAPVPNQAVEAIRVATADESLAFSSAGSCTSRVTSVDSGTKCVIDNADRATRTNGDVKLVNIGSDEVGKGQTVWVWHGDIGDKFTADDVDEAFMLSVPPYDTAAGGPVSAAISDSLPDGIDRARFGATVTVTVQLKDAADGAGDDTGPGNLNAPDGVEYTVVINKRATTDGSEPGTSGDAFFADTLKVKVADDGSATFMLDASDANPNAMGNKVRVSYTVSGGDFSGTEPAGPNLDPATTEDGSVVFSDEASVVTALSVEVAPYQDAPGTGKANSAATVTVTDQFGKPLEDKGIVLSSDVDASEFSKKERFTGSDGRVRIGYTYTGGAAKEMLTATYTPAGDSPTLVTGTANAFWVIAWEKDDDNSGTQAAAAVLNADLDANQVVIETGTNAPKSVNYDSGDFFTVGGEPSSMATFEEQLGKVLEAKKKATAGGGSFDGILTLSWQSYDHEDSADIASFTLVATLPDS